MGLFIFAILIAIAGVIAIVAAPLAKRTNYHGETTGSPGLWRAGGAAVLVLAFLMYMVSGFKSVPTKNVGVPVSFGKVTSGVYGPGLHVTWTPWLHLTDVNETIQTTQYEDHGRDNPASGQCDGGLAVRIGGQQGACADVTIQWQVQPSAAGGLFLDYASSGDLMTEITNAVVVRELKTVVNNTIGDYNPITDVQSVTNTNSQTSQFTQFSPQIETAMRSDLTSRIKIDAVYLPLIHYSSQVEGKLQAIQQAYANFAVAQENVKVNDEQAKANKALGTPSGPALEQFCLNLANEGKLPRGTQCFPNTGGISSAG